MSQNDMSISVAEAATGALFRTAVNAALQALASCNSGDSEPTTTWAGMLWGDTLNGYLKQRNASNDGWVNLWKWSTTITDFAFTLLDDADASTALSTLGVTAFAKTLLDDTTALAARNTLGANRSITYVDDYAVGDDTADDTAAIAAAITAASAGNILMFGPKTYKITDEITISKALTLSGYGYASKIRQATSNKGGFKATVSNVNLYDVHLYGPQHTASQSAEIAFNAYGATWATAISKIKVENCYFANWGQGAVQLTYLTDFRVNNNVIDGIHYQAICTLSAVGGDISHNKIDDVPGSVTTSWDAYGIIMTRSPQDSLTSDPRSADITVIGNRISNIPTWHGINTHAGANITISNNIVKGCKWGIVATGCSKFDGTPRFAPWKVTISNNVVDAVVADGSYDIGITVNGAYYSAATVEYAYGCVVTGNSVYRHGPQASNISGAMYFYSTYGLVCNGNVLRECGGNGIVLSADNVSASITGGSILDVFSETAVVCGVKVLGAGNVDFIISDIAMGNVTSTSTFRLNTAGGIGVLVADETGNGGKLGLITGNLDTLLSDPSSPDRVSKNLNA